MGKDLRGRELGEGVSQRKYGRYTARFTTCKGKRKQGHFDKVLQAKDWIRDARYKDAHGFVSSADMLVDAWYEYWIENIKGENIRYRTRLAYDHAYHRWISPYIGKMLLREVKQMHCQNIVNAEQRRGFGQSSVKHLIMILNMLFQSAVENELIETHPMRSKLQYKRDDKKERRVLTVAEQKHFLEVARNYVYYDLYCLALQTGMRFGELAGLQWDDVDFKNWMITPTEKAGVILNRNGRPLKLDDCDGALHRIADSNGMERFSARPRMKLGKR